MPYNTTESLLSSRKVTKTALHKLPIRELSRQCSVQGLEVNPSSKRAGLVLKLDYVEAIWKFVDQVHVYKKIYINIQ